MDLNEINKFLEIDESNAKLLLSSILDDIHISNKIKVSDNIYNDTKIDDWATSKTITRGGAIVIDKIIKNPINDPILLKKRQEVNYEIFNYQLQTLKDNEKEILWIMTLKKEIEEDMSINLLFPSTYLINKLNNYRIFLDTYHLYKTVFMPISCLFYPVSIILAPYYYLSKYLGTNITFYKYMEILFQLLKILLKPSGNYKQDLTKIISVFIYIGIYIYSIYQTFVISYIVYKTREKLLAKIKGLVDFIKTAINLVKRSKDIWKPYFIYNHQVNDYNIYDSIRVLDELKYDITTIYKLWKNEDFKKSIITLLKVVYTLDVISVISKLKKNKEWTLPEFINNNKEKQQTKIWGMKNPLLDNNQISNPVDLKKSLIITGVNAGGKTTYVKAIASNIILAQTFGVIYATRGSVLLYDAIISFMRITDEVGINSYFEAETDCCSKMIDVAEDLNKNNKKGLFLLDEPMHSTPPIEGMSVAYAIALYLGKMKGMRMIITTHFHKLIELEDSENLDESKFMNLSVIAHKENTNKYKFDYKICRGGSKQTIAIELLKKHKLNDEIINSAIEIKNKLCNEVLRNDL
jgi:predicted ATPase